MITNVTKIATDKGYKYTEIMEDGSSYVVIKNSTKDYPSAFIYSKEGVGHWTSFGKSPTSQFKKYFVKSVNFNEA